MSYVGFYINLERSGDRRKHMEAQLAWYNLQACYTRVAGADGNVLGLPNGRLTASEIGCFTSHYLVLRQNLGCRSHLHVMEDDTVLSDVTRKTVEQMTDLEALDGFDMIFTQTGLLEEDIIGCKRLFDNSKIMRDHTGKIISYNLNRIEFRSCTGSYIVNCHSIPKILGLYEEELHKGAELPVDLFIRSKIRQGSLSAVCLFPFVTTDLRGGESLIGSRAGSALSRQIADIVRRSFYIDRDLNELLRETANSIPYDETDLASSILSRNIHFMMGTDYVRH